LTHSII